MWGKLQTRLRYSVFQPQCKLKESVIKKSFDFKGITFSHLKTKVKFMFSKKAIKIDEIFTVDLTLCSKRQIDVEDFVNFRDLLRKYEL